MTLADSVAARKRHARVWPSDLATVQLRVARTMRRLRQGATRPEIAAELGVSQASVTRYLNLYCFGEPTVPGSLVDLGLGAAEARQIVQPS